MQFESPQDSSRDPYSQSQISSPQVPIHPSPDSLRATQPRPVVKVLSPMGVEYVFLTLTLFVSAGALVSVLLALVNGRADFDILAFPAAALLVTMPVFGALFLRLKKLELRNPELRFDASKRHTTQLTQIVAFIVSLMTIIALVYAVFAKLGGQISWSIGKAALDALCVLVVSGGILAYYWHDEHRNR